MLYMIRTWGRGGKSMIKVGYTSDLPKRMENYYHSNPFFEKISAREGSLEDEKRLQLYLEVLGYKMGILDEWFVDSPEVQTLFHESKEKISRVLWRYRNSVWKKEDLKQGADQRLRDIYENLRKKYLKGYGSDIDKEYSMIVAQETLKAMRSEEYCLYDERLDLLKRPSKKKYK